MLLHVLGKAVPRCIVKRLSPGLQRKSGSLGFARMTILADGSNF